MSDQSSTVELTPGDDFSLIGGWFQIVSGGKTWISSPRQLEVVVSQEFSREAAQEVLDAVINRYHEGIQRGKREARAEMRKALGVLEP